MATLTVHVSNGPASLDVELTTNDQDPSDCRNVADVLALARDSLNIPADATPTVNGDPVDTETPVSDGDEVAFTKTAGSKG